jgi:hypothetical protein
MNETSRLCLKFAKSSASIADYDTASANLKDSISKGATAEELLVLSRAADKSLDELDSQNVRHSASILVHTCQSYSPALVVLLPLAPASSVLPRRAGGDFRAS